MDIPRDIIEPTAIGLAIIVWEHNSNDSEFYVKSTTKEALELLETSFETLHGKTADEVFGTLRVRDFYHLCLFCLDNQEPQFLKNLGFWGVQGRFASLEGYVFPHDKNSLTMHLWRPMQGSGHYALGLDTVQGWYALMKKIPDFVVVIDREGQFLYTNQIAPGVSYQEVLNHTIYDYSEREYHEKIRSLIKFVEETGEIASYEVKAYRSPSSWAYYMTNIIPLQRPGASSLFLLVSRDFTEIRATQDALHQAQKRLDRQRLARDLHDSVTQALYGLTLLAEANRRDSMDKAREGFARIGSIGQQALKEMRLLIYELMPDMLEQHGLIGAIEHRLETVEKRSSLQVHFGWTGKIEYVTHLEKDLYYIVLEALNNSVKHALANKITLQIAVQEDAFHMSIEDDGRGFEPQALSHHGGFGLANMHARAEELDAQLSIKSSPNKGTQVTLHIAL